MVSTNDQPMHAELDLGSYLVELAWGSRTDVGNARQLNEDSLVAKPPVFVVADGMGGHQGGEVASSLAIGVMASLGDTGFVDRSTVVATVESANALINSRSSGSERGMGTTLSGIVATRTSGEAALTVINVGDSRTYRLREGAFSQLTVDHSHVQELIEAGLLDPTEAGHHPDRNVVTRALGVDPDVDVDAAEFAIAQGDRFLICSDGLTGELSDESIATMISLGEPNTAADNLVELVLLGAARDNVSVIIVDVVRLTAQTTGQHKQVRSDDTTSPRKRLQAPQETETRELIDDVPPIEPNEDTAVVQNPAPLIDEVPSIPNESRDVSRSEERFE